MKEYLVFRLYGPMASWGQAAVGGDRATGLQPTRSAILGLLGAALGIQRDDAVRLSALQNSVLIAVKQTTPTSLLRDYHTTQVPSHSKKVVHHTRKSELEEDKLNTILSSRDYRCDGYWIIAVCLSDSSTITLSELASALQKPVFTLSLGRKSCPLAAPLAPRIIAVNSLKDALDIEFPSLTRSIKDDALWLGTTSTVSYFWEGATDEFDSAATLATHPWDEPICRERWQFKQRIMYQLTLQES
ncbi:type I-E CRISPR-associated protein Cas5/CasD [Neptunomonas sp.]|uniref:type I-E CRISPR-associated protein Cas5/CasD n=1 Tax=Neptunomonas sp. TaxID=1971898 RepID=UPI0035672DF7